jgi:hypothetical protein
MLTKKHPISRGSFEKHRERGCFWFFSLCLSLIVFSAHIQAQPLLADLKPILDTKTHSIYIYKSSIKNLPPDWKKVWVLTNFYQQPNQPTLTILSTRRNILFDCRKNRFSTLAHIRYGEANAMGKPLLQTDSGFDLKEREVPTGSPIEIIKDLVCSS